jgi:hypothetical protein
MGGGEDGAYPFWGESYVVLVGSFGVWAGDVRGIWVGMGELRRSEGSKSKVVWRYDDVGAEVGTPATVALGLHMESV